MTPPLRPLGFFLLTLALLIGGWGIADMARAEGTEHWTSTRGIVDGMKITSGGIRYPNMHIGRVNYTYDVGGSIHSSRNVTLLGSAIFPRGNEAERAAQRYAFGNQVAVRYNPDNPRQAVLETGVEPIMPYLQRRFLYALGFLIVSGLVLLNAYPKVLLKID